MTITANNPIGLDGFEFVEFTSPDPARMVELIEQLGFTAYAKHPTKNLVRYKQGRINLLVNQDASGQVAEFRAAHGPSANGMAFRVADAKAAFEGALARGAVKAEGVHGGALGNDYPYILLGIGGSLLAGLATSRGRGDFHRAGCLASVIGAIVLILVGRLLGVGG